uniref:Uncharacterized protein n=1 Tax=Anopheles funestus TaxID=62324 RepID=A0A182RFN5_ANOFN
MNLCGVEADTDTGYGSAVRVPRRDISEMGDTGAPKRTRKKPSGILKLDNVRRRESSGSSLLQLGDEVA